MTRVPDLGWVKNSIGMARHVDIAQRARLLVDLGRRWQLHHSDVDAATGGLDGEEKAALWKYFGHFDRERSGKK